MQRRLVPVLALGLATIAAGCATAAAATWQTVDYTVPTVGIGPVSTHLAPDGTTTAAWAARRDASPATRSGYAVIGSDGTLNRSGGISGAPAGLLGGTSGDPHARLVTVVDRPGAAEAVRVTAVGAGAGRARLLGSGANGIGPVAVATSAGGGSVVAWLSFGAPVNRPAGGTSVFRTSLQYAIRFVDGSWSRTRTLATFRAGDDESTPKIAAARTADGRSTIAAETRDTPSPALRAWSGTGARPTALVRIATKQPLLASLAVATSRAGVTVAAWAPGSIGEEPHIPWSVHTAVLSRGKAGFGRINTIDRGTVKAYAQGRLALAASPAGGLTLAWIQARAKGQQPLAIAAGSDAGRFDAPQVFPGVFADPWLAVRSDGAAIATASAAEDAGAPITAWRAAGAAAFSTGPALPSPGRGGDPTFNPRDGSVVVGLITPSGKGGALQLARTTLE